MMVSLASACFWFGLYVVTKWTWLANRRVKDRGKLAVSLFALFAVLQAATVVIFAAAHDLSDGLALSAITGLTSMGCMFVLYMPLYYTIATSISVQSLIEVSRRGGQIPVERLYDMFASRQIVSTRLETMCRNGYLNRAGDAFELTFKSKRVVALFRAIKRIWKLGAGG
jgi:hypothetical protein